MTVHLFVVIQIYNLFSSFLLFNTYYHSKCRMNHNFPVIVGGGYDMDSATVMVIEKKKGELRIKVLNTKGEILLNITV